MLNRLSGALVAVAMLTAGTAAPAAADDYDGAYFKRINLVVADLDRALTIYRDVLGFDLDAVSTSGPDSYSYPVFKIPRSAKMRFATLSAGEEQVRTLALTEVKGVELQNPSSPHMSASVIRVNDIAKTFWEIDALGLETTQPKFVEGQREFDFWERAFVDYDGHLIVLYEIVSKKN